MGILKKICPLHGNSHKMTFSHGNCQKKELPSHSVAQKSVFSLGLNRSKPFCYLSMLPLYTRLQRNQIQKSGDC